MTLAGHTADMISRIKFNEAQKELRKQRKWGKKLPLYLKKHPFELSGKDHKITEAELEVIRKRLKRFDQIQIAIGVIIIISTTIFLFHYFGL